jgi:prepilin-type N-terminal cleavage/methylation domain-containing protein
MPAVSTQSSTYRVVRPVHRGFTLIEIGVTLCVVALLVGIAIPAISNVTGLQSKAEVGKLMANIRATRGHAAVAGETCRMVFDIEGSAYSVECVKGSVTIQAEKVRNGEIEKPNPKDIKSEKDMTEAEKTKKRILERVRFAAVPTLLPQRLKGGIVMESVWTAHQEEKYVKGKAYLYFFPSGSSENANIVLHWGEDYFTVVVSPTTGKVSLLPRKVEKTIDGRDDYF